MSTFQDFPIRWGMVIDIDKCTGCGACVVACNKENNIAPQENQLQRIAGKGFPTRFKKIEWLTIYELTDGSDTAYLPRPCMQCGMPSCVSVCPAIATDKNENGGIVSQIYPRCFGCRYCMASCPYHARVFNWDQPVWPEGMEKQLTPHTSVRSRGVVEKCSFCHHRLMYAKDAARVAGEDPEKLPDGAYVPACGEVCPTGAITFGDVKNPEHAVYELVRSPYTFRLLERLGTDPQVYYMSKRAWVRLQGDNYLANEEAQAGEGGAHHG
ncbi:4Fe-4S dicluster domain-containing protein [Desulfocurvus sp.]|uniref:4Fe-4S dicluster domain-containing protein n=1 Tax=Desulfocurvus sp. TaxID=2871698 RepID=UPI0025C22067|nr:4Fe-4S dicluster domain-containing protein [Desulfocurvus sp.]MCK9240010.1 4Fe-4S dicluster domain-containing protein [Desulfocurvus sp.]